MSSPKLSMSVTPGPDVKRGNNPGRLGRQPIKLGAMTPNYNGPIFGDVIDDEEKSDDKPLQKAKRNMLVTILVATVIIGAVSSGIIVLILAVTKGNNATALTGGSSPQALPTAFPTSPVTARPTRSPTLFTTNAPTTPTTIRPTLAPTAAPTLPPTTICTDPDPVCGCLLVESQLIDVIFVVDESGSVNISNFVLMKEAIMDFATKINPPMNPINGSRIGYIEFSFQANDIIDLSQTNSSEELIPLINATAFNGGGTNHTAAFLAVEEMLLKPENELRPGSQLLLVLLSDGAPCNSCAQAFCPLNTPANLTCVIIVPKKSSCCSDSVESVGGIDVLDRIYALYNFTFFILPIVPPEASGFPPPDLSHFFLTDIPAEDIRLFPEQGFDQLDSTLQGEEFEFPLGPCVVPPTPSNAQRELLTIDSFEEFDNDLENSHILL